MHELVREVISDAIGGDVHALWLQGLVYGVQGFGLLVYTYVLG